MIYLNGDCHGDFRRFTKKQRMKLPFELTEDDFVIVCGDFTLLWAKDKELEYNLDWMSRLPFTLLWVQGNHENYDMIAEYPVEMWNGGKTRHILRDKIILLERGQVFNIQGYSFFTFGGASSHDVQGGILDIEDPHYDVLRIEAIRAGLPYRVIGKSWWKEELPTEEEMQEGLINLEKVNWQVNYIISHCASNRVQYLMSLLPLNKGKQFEADILTDYFDKIESKLNYKHWFCGHYHRDMQIDEKHTVLYQKIVPLNNFTEYFQEDDGNE